MNLWKLHILITSRSEYLNKVKWNVNRRICDFFFSLHELFKASFREITFSRRPLREESCRQLQPPDSCWSVVDALSSPNSSFIPPTFSEKIDPEMMSIAFSIWSVLHCMINLKRFARLEFLWSLNLVCLFCNAMVVCLLSFLPLTTDNKPYQFSASAGYTLECNLCEQKCFWLIEI